MCRLAKTPFPLLALVLSLTPTGGLTAQTQPLRPVTVGSPMPDFTLPVFQGGEITLSELRGQNVMIVFPRGLSRPGSWCHICPYQHSELVEYEAQTGWQARANLKILFVLPYSQEMIARVGRRLSPAPPGHRRRKEPAERRRAWMMRAGPGWSGRGRSTPRPSWKQG